MKLYLNAASPYARLVRVVLIETGLAAVAELHHVDPWTSPPELLIRNPAAKVPALELEDGTRLIESSCICDYLVGRSGRADLAATSPGAAAARLPVLGRGRAAIDCAFGAVLLERSCRDTRLRARWLDALPRIAASLDSLYSDSAPGDAVDLADLTVAVAFEYVDFRLPEVAWRVGRRQLARRITQLSERESLATTHPQSGNG